ncbi:uncharacterized protein LOC121878156 [Homarus americanus]|uniref:uncharacterized protein LOC121878156 n=1 Tax=Homarus americanus TaxID=6706 RepID=UPI001C46D419|nr:uncharacterized protein LOC121878156 [Homarus americanus]
MQCASTCVTQEKYYRAFNINGTSPAYNCYIMATFHGFMEDPLTNIYYDRDMYEKSGFHQELGRRVFYPTPASSALSWLDAYSACKEMWASFLMPLTQQEWDWMKGVAANNGYNEMWVGIMEGYEEQGSYFWMQALETFIAPGNVSISWEDDGYSLRGWDTVLNANVIIDDNIDCTLLIQATSQIVIEDCYKQYNFVGYICEAVLPNP